MSSFVEKVKEFLDPLSTAQQTLFFGLIGAILIFTGTVFYWGLSPSYTLLFGSLEQEAAQQIVTELDERGINYELDNGGSSIYVSNEQVDQLRLELAPMGAPKSDMKGYELFDNNSLGMTDYMQQLNNKRALEGELSRSVNSLQQVESSRVHLVLPERSPFQESMVKASASVLLTLKRGEKLEKSRVDGITSLISGSVEGLEAKNVTIVDHAGNRLTDDHQNEGGFASENGWLKSEKKTENYLARRGQTMLDRVLGPGNSIVRVSVDQNFDSLVRESNNIDPESRTLISEQRDEQVETEEGSEMVPVDEFTPVENRGETSVITTNENESTSRTRNYDVSEIKEVYKKAQGEITNITASILVNHKKIETVNDQGETVYETEPYTEEELQEFRDVIASALGVRDERGDDITIRQVEFWSPEQQPPAGQIVDGYWPWSRVIRGVVMIMTLGLIIWLLFGIRRQMRGGQPGLALQSAFGDQQQVFSEGQMDFGLESKNKEEMENLMGDQDEEGVKALKGKSYDMEEIINMVDMKPDKAAKIIRSMLISTDDDE
ncbi:flagellar basal-body MS-ring/collar protein FliF [Fodinibius salsisoli]|uniref:Flagellar M-ring protein n=1 Tax=Fodinibius salsisoli TaxID=2820877 RepID=A0ABT3PHI2_9BACT|nr:flagellar basal-body MS-ring/collar protein FliF [Fodinibius salsisoli]MCW9705380.1 flagellar M-ring protein FliF [Fodinibius salsisoli]